MGTSCALALDGVDDGERCTSIGIWYRCACSVSINPHMRVDMYEVAFVRCSRRCVETRVDMFVIEGAARMVMSDDKWHVMCLVWEIQQHNCILMKD